MRRLAPLLLMLLVGCPAPMPHGAERPPNSDDMRVIDAVRDAWRAAGNPWTAQCQHEHSQIVVVRADQETSVGGYCASRGPCCGTPERQASCGCMWTQGGMGCAAGATTREADSIQPFAGLADDWRVMLWVSAYEDAPTQARLIAHEYTHALGHCALRDSDAGHRRAGWWGAQGVESAAW